MSDIEYLDEHTAIIHVEPEREGWWARVRKRVSGRSGPKGSAEGDGAQRTLKDSGRKAATPK